MGGHDFQHYQAGSNMDAAYKQAVADAQYEDGHSGYSGTIATTYGVIKKVHQPMTLNGARLFGSEDDTVQRWEAAHAVPVADDERFTFKKVKFTIELPVRKPVLDWDDKPKPGETKETTEWDLNDAARAEALKRYGIVVHDIEVEAKLKAKVIAEPTPGTAVTRYAVTDGYNRQKLHTTKAQAIKAASDLLLSRTGYPLVASVKAVRYWPDADTTDAVVLRKQTVSAKADVTVTVATPKTTLTIDGWLFYGIACS